MKSLFKALLSFLVKKDFLELFLLISLIVFTAIIELVGIGSLFPYMKVLSNPDVIHSNHLLKRTYQFFHFKSTTLFEIVLGIGIFSVVLLKGFMSCLNNYKQTKFSSKISIRLSKNCLSNYLKYPYNKYINMNSTVLAKNILVDIDCSVQAITALLSIATDTILAIVLIILMLWVDTKLIISIALFLALSLYLVVKNTRKSIKKIGRENERYNQQVYKLAYCSLQALKDIKLHGVQDYFTNQYIIWKSKVANNAVLYNVISNIPSTLLNVLSFGLMIVILIYFLVTQGNLMSVLPIIAVIAAATQRLVPTITRMSTSFGLVLQYIPNVLVIKGILDMPCDEALPKRHVEFNHLLRLKNASFHYGNCKKMALTNINLDIIKNRSIGIVGESGAGKSTLVDVLLGLLPICNGEILCDGVPIKSLKEINSSHLIGYVPQQTYLLDSTIAENIAFGIDASKINSKQLLDAIKIAQLANFVDELPEGLSTIIGENGVRLSGGQRQRLGIARALYHNPEILIMDEATNSLDSVTEKEFNMALQELKQKKTLIIIAHRHTSVKFCDQLIVLNAGKITDIGTHEQLSTSSEIYRRLYATNLKPQPELSPNW